MNNLYITTTCIAWGRLELHVMIKLAEKCLPKKAPAPIVLAVRGGKSTQRIINRKLLMSRDMVKDMARVGHWRRNCPVYLAEFEEEQN
ncbi:hypothetical protein Tco_0194953 [Tanacetum coccineum]